MEIKVKTQADPADQLLAMVLIPVKCMCAHKEVLEIVPKIPEIEEKPVFEMSHSQRVSFKASYCYVLNI